MRSLCFFFSWTRRTVISFLSYIFFPFCDNPDSIDNNAIIYNRLSTLKLHAVSIDYRCGTCATHFIEWCIWYVLRSVGFYYWIREWELCRLGDGLFVKAKSNEKWLNLIFSRIFLFFIRLMIRLLAAIRTSARYKSQTQRAAINFRQCSGYR